MPRLHRRIFSLRAVPPVARRTCGMISSAAAAPPPGNALVHQSRGARLIWFILFGALLAMPIATWCQAGASPPDAVLTLERAVNLALQNNRLVQNAVLEVNKTADQVAAARTQRLPVLKLRALGRRHLTRESYTFEQGVFGNFPATGPIPAEETSITTTQEFTALITARVTQPLSQLYVIGLGIEQLEVVEEMAQQALRSRRQTTVNNVKQVYYGILQTESALEATEEAVTFLRELDREVENDVKQQVALKSANLEVKTRLAKTEHKALVLRNTLASEKEQLNDLMERDIRTKFHVNPVPEPRKLEVDLAAAQARAMAQRPEIKEAQLKVKQAKYAKRITKAKYIPELSLTANFSSHFGVELLPKDVATIGLQLEWEFFDWDRKQHQLSEDIKAIKQADNAVLETESQVLIEVNSRARKLQEARALLRVNQLGQETAREKLRVMMNKYKQRVVLLSDPLRAQTSLAEANNQYQQALLDFWTARANFEKALGEE